MDKIVIFKGRKIKIASRYADQLIELGKAELYVSEPAEPAQEPAEPAPAPERKPRKPRK